MSRKPLDMPAGYHDAWRAQFGDVPAPRAFTHGALTAFVNREPVADGDLRWHISIRYGEPGTNGRVPSWGELVEAAHALRPGIVFVVGLPPRSWWINVHPDVLHLWEYRDPHLEAQWKSERRGDRPT